MKKNVFAVAVVMCLSAGVALAAGTTSITITKTGLSGKTLPVNVGASGAVSLDSTVIGWSGLQYKITDANQNSIYGFTNLPNGAPKQGGAAVQWSGTASTNVAGTYEIKCTMSYIDQTMQPQTKSAQQNINVP